jgi:hypothetical protein
MPVATARVPSCAHAAWQAKVRLGYQLATINHPYFKELPAFYMSGGNNFVSGKQNLTKNAKMFGDEVGAGQLMASASMGAPFTHYR